MYKLIFFVIYSTLAITRGYIPQTCTKISPCVCRDERGQYVDLRPISRNDGIPVYKDHQVDASSEPAKYSFNPCYAFNEGKNNSSCFNVAVCRIIKNGMDFIDIGTQNSASFGHFDNGNLSLEFTSSNKKYQTTVSLYCDQNVEGAGLRVVGEMANNFFWLQLRSKHCCPIPKTDIREIEEILVPRMINQSSGNVTMPSPAPPHVVTMTSAPDPVPHKLDNITIVLLAIFGLLVLILAVFLVLLLRKAFMKRRRFNTEIVYQPLPTEEPPAYGDKDFGIFFQ